MAHPGSATVTARAIRRVGVLAAVTAGALTAACAGSAGTATDRTPGRTDVTRAATSTAPSSRPGSGPAPFDTTTLVARSTISGPISPKSVTATGTGLVFAQNMMYRHTVTVYDADGRLVRTIPDAVSLADLGYPDRQGVVQGAPVEAAASADGRTVWVSNYSMYGEGFDHPGDDRCSPASGVDDSYLYRIDTATLAVDGVVRVGAVPKHLAVSPDGRRVVVANWCSYDVSIVDAAARRELARVPVGPYPRGVAISRDGRRAYVAVMGGTDLAVLDLSSATVTSRIPVGRGPRHLVLSPDGTRLYVTLNATGEVLALDTATGAAVRRVAVGPQPRTMAIAPDGRALYVVVYDASALVKLAADDLRTLQRVPTGTHPIGVTFEPRANRVWIAVYTGHILVFDEVVPAAP
jgi:YVTN family beta-propeller protein